MRQGKPAQAVTTVRMPSRKPGLPQLKKPYYTGLGHLRPYGVSPLLVNLRPEPCLTKVGLESMDTLSGAHVPQPAMQLRVPALNIGAIWKLKLSRVVPSGFNSPSSAPPKLETLGVHRSLVRRGQP